MIFLLTLIPAVFAQNQTTGPHYISYSTPDIIDVDLRTLPKPRNWQPGDPIKEIPMRGGDPGVEPAPSPFSRDPLLEYQEDVRGVTIDPEFGNTIINMNGQGFTGVTPPDTVGAVGVNYYIQAVNQSGGTRYTIYNKDDGTVAAGPFTLDALGSGACASGLGDPIVLYDQLANRWFISEFNTGINNACIYISQTADPIAGGWFAYGFSFPDNIDYPKYGLWPDGYYMTSNNGFTSPNIIAVFEREQMLLGATAGVQSTTVADMTGFIFQGQTPSNVDGPPPPANTPNFFMRHRDDEIHNPGSNDPGQDFLDYFEFDVTWGGSPSINFTGPTSLAIAEFDSEFCGLSLVPCIVQPSGGQLHPLKEIIMHRLVYRNFGTYEVLLGSFVTDVDATNHAGVRWFEMRRSGGGPWAIHQEGTVALDADSRWMSSIAMDGSGNIALGYTVTGSVTFPSLRYIGRLATDPLNTMPQGEYSGVEGSASNSSTRWGDYSAMNVCPVDDSTFWYTGEYNPSSSWNTRIFSFKFQDCAISAPANLAVSAPGLNDNEINWDPIRGGTTYSVYRAEGACGASPTLIASGLPTTTYNDHDVTPGVVYSYAVTASLSANCESDLSGCQQTTAAQCSTLLGEIENWNDYLSVLDLIDCIPAP